MYHSISLDDWAEESHQWLGEHQDGGAGHYAMFEGTKEKAVYKCLNALKPLVEKMMYESDDYGYPKED